MHLPAIISKLLLLPIIVAVVASPLASPKSHKPDDPPPRWNVVKHEKGPFPPPRLPTVKHEKGPFPPPPPPSWTMVKHGKGPFPKSAVHPDDPSWCKFVHGYDKGWVSVYSRDWGRESQLRVFQYFLEEGKSTVRISEPHRNTRTLESPRANLSFWVTCITQHLRVQQEPWCLRAHYIHAQASTPSQKGCSLTSNTVLQSAKSTY